MLSRGHVILEYMQLETSLAIKREEHFEKASKALGVSPVAIARHVGKLGLTLRTILLSRKPTRPTEAGEALCNYAEQIEPVEQQLLDEQRDLGLQTADSID